MSYLLDVNALLAALFQIHPQFDAMQRWCKGKRMVVCPLAGLGFLRISTQPSGPFKIAMKDAKALLAGFVSQHDCEFIPDDFPLANFAPRASKSVTDDYLAQLAARHNLKLATFDEGIHHSAVELIPAAPANP